MGEGNKRVLAVIPCFNEEATIGSVVLKAKRHVDEVVVIDDGSTDKTAKIAKYAGATVIAHNENKGYGAALKSGFEYARENDFDVMTILDGDGQHDADQIQTVMRPVSEGKADICVGSRFFDSTGNMIPMYRHFGIAVLTKFTNAGSDIENKVTDGQSGFRAYSRKAIENIDLKDTQMGASAEILLQGRKNHLKCEEVPITCSYEGDCSTEQPVGHGLGVLISILKYFEIEHSLFFFGLPGFIMFVAGLLFGFGVYVSYKDGGYIPFGPAIVTVLLLTLGALAGMTGLILHAVINANRRV
jgi:glycosyltransferase involved in cell wall biosynthesis